ncbi:hypothetical protein AB3N59_12700 [Leptospira sp. WS92.C1]
MGHKNKKIEQWYSKLILITICYMHFFIEHNRGYHANAGRRYSELRHFEESPQLPYGYELMVLIALVPPLWFRVMDGRLEEWRRKQCGLPAMETTFKK